MRAVPARLVAPRPIAARVVAGGLAAPRAISAWTIARRLVAPRPITVRPLARRFVAPWAISAWTIAWRLVAPRAILARTVARRFVAPRAVAPRASPGRLACPRAVTAWGAMRSVLPRLSVCAVGRRSPPGPVRRFLLETIARILVGATWPPVAAALLSRLLARITMHEAGRAAALPPLEILTLRVLGLP